MDTRTLTARNNVADHNRASISVCTTCPDGSPARAERGGPGKEEPLSLLACSAAILPGVITGAERLLLLGARVIPAVAGAAGPGAGLPRATRSISETGGYFFKSNFLIEIYKNLIITRAKSGSIFLIMFLVSSSNYEKNISMNFLLRPEAAAAATEMRKNPLGLSCCHIPVPGAGQTRHLSGLGLSRPARPVNLLLTPPGSAQSNITIWL